MNLSATLKLSKEELHQAITEFVAKRTKHPIEKIGYKFDYRSSGINESEPYLVKEVILEMKVPL